MTLLTGDVSRKRLLFQVSAVGLSLVEVLVAVSILSVGITGILRVYSSSLEMLDSAGNSIEMICLVKEKISGLKEQALGQEGVFPSSQRGEYPEPFDKVQWSWTVSPGFVDGLDIGTLDVAAEGSAKTFSLTMFIERPQ